MKLESAAVDAGEEVATQPGNQNRQGAETERKERDHESTPVMERNLQQAAIALTKAFKGHFKALLKAHQRIAASGMSRFPFFSPQEVLGHRRDDGPGQKIRRQHSENHCLGERYKEVTSHAG